MLIGSSNPICPAPSGLFGMVRWTDGDTGWQSGPLKAWTLGTDLWKKKAAEKEREREAGVLLLFEEERGVGLAGVTGWGREPNMHGRAPLLPCERRPIVPGTFQSGFPEVPCHSPSPHHLSRTFSPFWIASPITQQMASQLANHCGGYSFTDGSILSWRPVEPDDMA
ncbi:hypothetical protein Q8A67_024462 [Cirrhinus molitorella]|uniref:Uncharacterized protein n=1 Tax=Cirrhinus molitorella TaxID=172907 RepID=A0AA88P073_9TELE|nr:hypothetical protein Q8A67_024462 [Cirrhinus molitorella]